MNWIKKGRIYEPDKSRYWSQLYGICPTPEYLQEEDVIRIYFGSTDEQKFGRISYLDVNAEDPKEVVYSHPEPVLDLGQGGTFDDCGVVPSSIIDVNNSKYLYYIGFQRSFKVPYLLFSGLAIRENSNANTVFKRYSHCPIIERSSRCYLSNGAPYVIKDSDVYKMWLWLGKSWIKINTKPYLSCVLAYATSGDAINWTIENESCIVPRQDSEFSVGRPCVIKKGNVYRMWYSIRHIKTLYRLGYAESADGINWERKDEQAGIDVSEQGWDSEMICYPSVITVKSKTFMFYNGNGNGKTGFGYAVLDE